MSDPYLCRPEKLILDHEAVFHNSAIRSGLLSSQWIAATENYQCFLRIEWQLLRHKVFVTVGQFYLH